MKKSLKAALLSALIFPGLGQLWLGRYLRGLAFVALETAALGVMVTKASLDALHLLEKIEAEGGAVDLVTIVHSAMTASLTTSDQLPTKYAAVVLVIGWVWSVLDAYLLGRKLDRTATATGTGTAGKIGTAGKESKGEGG